MLAVAFGGGVGAVLRWLADVLIPRPAGFPLGTTIVNVVGSLLLGLVVGADVAVGTAWLTPFSVGVLGGFTTFSTWMVDIDEAPSSRATVAVAGIPLVLGLLAASVGVVLGAEIG